MTQTNPETTITDPSRTTPLRGFTTVNYRAADVAAAAAWYAEFLGVEPYFVQPPAPRPPAYVEFRIGDLSHELGIIDSRYLPEDASVGGVVMYWHVDDVEAVHARLLGLGATAHTPITERGPGFVTASVLDPFGNILGIMFNRHYLDQLPSDRG